MEKRTKLYTNNKQIRPGSTTLTLRGEAHVLPLLAQPAHRQCTTLLARGASERISRRVHAEAVNRAE
jgi:hypothetical protein